MLICDCHLWVQRAVTMSLCGIFLVGDLAVVSAHTGGSTGYASIVVSRNGAIRYSLALSPAALPPPVAEELRLAQAGSQRSTEKLLNLLREKITLGNEGTACASGPGYLERSRFTSENVTLVLDFACPQPLRSLTVRDDLFDAFGPDHHTLAKIELPDVTHQFAFAHGVREVRLPLREQEGSATWSGSFFLLGVHHILSGYDHLLFLLGLLLRGGGVMSLLKIITAFTLAHSVTLAVAVLGLVHLPDRVVEAVIALSIAFVAAENLFARVAVSRRWVVSFLFGLVHGFGFSSALRELGLPRQGLVLSLLGFNLGVEAGQALVVALTLPLLFRLRRTRWEARTVLGSSLAIIVVGLVLFIGRALL